MELPVTADRWPWRLMVRGAFQDGWCQATDEVRQQVFLEWIEAHKQWQAVGCRLIVTVDDEANMTGTPGGAALEFLQYLGNPGPANSLRSAQDHARHPTERDAVRPLLPVRSHREQTHPWFRARAGWDCEGAHAGFGLESVKVRPESRRRPEMERAVTHWRGFAMRLWRLRTSTCVGIAILILAFGILPGGPSASLAAPDTRSGGSLIVAIRAEPDTLDPHATGSRRSYAVMKNVFDTLVYRGPDNKFYPALAVVAEQRRRTHVHIHAAAGSTVSRRHAVQRERRRIQPQPHRRSGHAVAYGDSAAWSL